MRVVSGHSQAFLGHLPLYYLLGKSGGIAGRGRTNPPQSDPLSVSSGTAF